jgi:hypothetical protein
MIRRRITLAATALALVAFPASAGAAEPEPTPPVAMPLNVVLGSCDGHQACEIEVSFDAVSGAQSYEAVIRGPDGNELVSAPAQPGANSYSVPYRGNGTYRVHVTAFGD